MSSNSPYLADHRSTDRCPGFITKLIQRCADRDEAALGSLFDHLYPLVARVVGGNAPSDLDDALVVATFRRLWDRAPTYDPKLAESVEWIVAQARSVRAEYGRIVVPHGPAALTG